jgi:hypothetical protein
VIVSQHFKTGEITKLFVFLQAVELGNRERLIAFCEVVQQTCPVGSFIKPTAGETPGYASEVWLHTSLDKCVLVVLLYYFIKNI